MSKICPNSIQICSKTAQNMSKICVKYVPIYPKYVQLLFIICSNLLKIIIKKSKKKCPDSVQNQLKFRSKYVKNPSKECLKCVSKICPSFVHNLLQTAQNLLKIIRKNLKSVQILSKISLSYVQNCQKSIQRMSEMCKKNVSTCSKML